MGYDEARVDLALFDELEQGTQVALHVCLAGLDGQRPIDDRAKRDLVEKAAIHAGHGDRAAVAAGQQRFAQRSRAVRRQAQRLLDAVVHTEQAVGVTLHTDRIDARVRAATACQVTQGLLGVNLLIVERLGMALTFRLLQPPRNAIDSDHTLRPEQEGAGNAQEPNRSTSPYGDGIARLDRAIFRGHVCSRKNVGQEQDLFVRQTVGHLDRTHVREGNARILGLASCITS